MTVGRFETPEPPLGYFDLPRGKYPPSRIFGMLVDGVGMSPFYLPGDLVIFYATDKIENSDDVAVKIAGSRPKLRRIRKTPAGILLTPLNPAAQGETYTAEEIKNLPVEILGVAVEQRRTLNNWLKT